MKHTHKKPDDARELEGVFLFTLVSLQHGIQFTGCLERRHFPKSTQTSFTGGGGTVVSTELYKSKGVNDKGQTLFFFLFLVLLQGSSLSLVAKSLLLNATHMAQGRHSETCQFLSNFPLDAYHGSQLQT